MKYGTLRLNTSVLDAVDDYPTGNERRGCLCTNCLTEGELENGPREKCTASRYQDSFA